jgi:hypothetical protein
MSITCKECDRLWEELAEATRSCTHLLKLQAQRTEVTLIVPLAASLRKATERHQAARQAILSHASAHAVRKMAMQGAGA